MGTRTVSRGRAAAVALLGGAMTFAAVSPEILSATGWSAASSGGGVQPTASSATLIAVGSTPEPWPTPWVGDLPRDGRPPGPTPTPQATCAAAPSSLQPAKVVSHGPRDKKVIALTFDDGYGPANTLRILSILERSHVNATFFPIGRAVVAYPTVWKQIEAAHFPIADHTYDHRSLPGMCFAAQVADLDRQQDAVHRVLGIDPIAVMRPPFGNKDRITPLAASAAGDRYVVLWGLDTKDWAGASARAIYLRGIGGGHGSIVLMHTFPSNTVRALPGIIAWYRSHGYGFVTIGQLLGVPGPVPFG